MKSLLAAALALACGCGPTQNPDGHGDGADAGGVGPGFIDASPAGTTGTVSGTVWAPGNAPGLVPTGHEIPISGAVVYVADERPPAIPDGVYCDPCQMNPPASTTTGPKGEFVLTGVRAGTRWLVIEKAQFRLEQEIVVSEELGVALSAEETTLPSVHDPAAGKWIPRVAVAIGDSDHVEDIFGKMGILGLDADGRTLESSFDLTDRVDLYGNPIDPPFAAHHLGSITDLFGDLDAMKRYHVIFVGCNYETDVSSLAQPAFRQHIADYVAAGGKIYVTDWSAEWADAAFPEFIEFDASHDTTKAMAAANLISLGDGDFGHFALHGRADDPDLAAWLDGQQGPLVVPLGGEELDFPSEYAEGQMVAGDFVIEGAWNLIRATPPVNLGVDAMGQTVTETAKTWISGDYLGASYPHTVTFEPSCGRVLYSSYHTAQQTHHGLIPQERVLLYLIMEIGVCNDGPIVE